MQIVTLNFFSKLMNNTVSGKITLNMRKYIIMSLINKRYLHNDKIKNYNKA